MTSSQFIVQKDLDLVKIIYQDQYVDKYHRRQHPYEPHLNPQHPIKFLSAHTHTHTHTHTHITDFFLSKQLEKFRENSLLLERDHAKGWKCLSSARLMHSVLQFS